MHGTSGTHGGEQERLQSDLTSPIYNAVRRRTYVALDVPQTEDALDIVDHLGDAVDGYKVGLELFYGGGKQVIDELAKRGKRVFLDIKLHDIPTTVAHALRVVCNWPIEMVNVHSAGGTAMLTAAREAVDKSSYRPLLIGVTVLTSLGEADLSRLRMPSGDELAVNWSQLCQAAGLDGVVTSALDVAAVTARCGQDFVTVVPGTRPAFASRDDQTRVLTPGEAVQRGASRLVLGRAVTQAENRLLALRAIWDEMRDFGV
ncbi:orotidine-5'-phosphate decarboxylase [Alicyclobacillus mengziensis]|uniref:Orotidine 5'-phosphate decarboxylase n=1 Tax=Alicyclobacillus mengziensis TaxID=2931921 RepID=A0A9X7W2G6_9BACL|nr:orotidine-5'-phosphate decarboxylase [Alicyclobacillus mengziensis]QSO49491.1 orotidine-5'-phosphate decarboxylase [Alicyclobacillus mengziensis]